MGYFQIIRADGSLRKYSSMIKMLQHINKEDLETLLKLVMLVEKNYALTPATITKMLNEKLQTDHWNEMCYQLLKLMTKQRKNPGSV
ncbi:hypothetical protein Tco_1580622 [Tanacetum coccineum]